MRTHWRLAGGIAYYFAGILRSRRGSQFETYSRGGTGATGKGERDLEILAQAKGMGVAERKARRGDAGLTRFDREPFRSFMNCSRVEKEDAG